MTNPSDAVNYPQGPPPAGAGAPARATPQPSVSFSIANPAGSQPAGAETRVDPFPIQAQASQLPLLPRRKRPTFSRHRHDANPALAVKVLQDIQMAVDAWHLDLRQTVQRIQALYMEGPIVDGWLEAVENQPAPGQSPASEAALLRHGDPQTLSGYVDRLCESLDAEGRPRPVGPEDKKATGYRLCSLDSDGRLRCLLCPPEQLSTISLAIARHQKLRQLIDHKQYLEAKLKRAVEVLTGSRDALGIAPTCSSEPELEP
ncbi:MAG: hypothetical protein ACFCVD_19560 [Nodosilinea sp.]